MLQTLSYDDVKIGDRLPELSIPVTAALIVGGAIASRDFTPVHHDARWAHAKGMPDIIMNILTTQGLISRFVTDWAGADSRLTGLNVKLGAPNYPGDTMRIVGKVTSKAVDGIVRIEVTASNSWGDHCNATVDVALPAGA